MRTRLSAGANRLATSLLEGIGIRYLDEQVHGFFIDDAKSSSSTTCTHDLPQYGCVMSTEKVNLADKLSLFDTYWDPKVVATYNQNEVMVVKFVGEYDFHSHVDTDDFFLVIEGEVTMDYRDRDSVTFGAGELVIVPAGVVHRPRADTEAKVLLIEPAGEPNSGDSDRTASAKERI